MDWVVFVEVTASLLIAVAGVQASAVGTVFFVCVVFLFIVSSCSLKPRNSNDIGTITVAASYTTPGDTTRPTHPGRGVL